MNKAVQLPSGKIIDLSRFIALIPKDDRAANHLYSLILDGYAEPIDLDSEETNSIKKHLQVETEKSIMVLGIEKSNYVSTNRK